MVLPLAAMYGLLYVDRANIATAGVVMRTDLGLSVAQLGLVFSAFAYPYAILQIAGGWIGDRLGPRLTLALCVTVCGVATALTGLAGGLIGLIGARLLLGISESAAFPVATRATAAWLPSGQWAATQGLMHSAARFGNAISPPLIAGLIHLANWRASFLVMAAVSLVWVSIWWRMTGRLTSAAPPAPRQPLSASDWRRLARRILPVTACDFCYGWGLWMFMNWIPSFFHDLLDQRLPQGMFLAALVFSAGVVGDVLGGILSDRLRAQGVALGPARRWVIGGGLLGAMTLMIPLLLTRDVLAVSLALAAAFLCLEMVAAPIWAVPMDIAPDHAGVASGMMNLGFGIAGIVSPLIVGGLVQWTGDWRWAFATTMVVLGVGVLLSLRLRPEVPFGAMSSA